MATTDLKMDGLYNLASISPTDRRRWDLKDVVSTIQPEFAAFVNLLRKLNREVTTDPIFKFLEYRPSWRHKRFVLSAIVDDTAGAPNKPISGATYYKITADSNAVNVTSYDLLQVGHTVRLRWETGGNKNSIFGIIVAKDNSSGENYWVAELSREGSDLLNTIPASTPVAVVGSAFAQGSYRPEYGVDQMSIAEGKTQIFKTAFGIDNTTLNTKLFGGSELRRMRTQALLNHQRELSDSFYWGGDNSVSFDGRTMQTFGGLYDQITAAGNVWDLDSQASTGLFDQLVDIAKNVFDLDPGGSRIVLTGGSLYHTLQKFSTGIYGNLGNNNARVNIQPKEKWGYQFTQVNTAYGTLNFTWDRALEDLGASMGFVLDFDYLKYRPLQNRDTQLETGIEIPGFDGVVNQYITETGLQVEQKERHHIINLI